MLKIKDNVDLKELEKFGYLDWDKEGAEIVYFKYVPVNSMIIQIFKDRRVDFQLPLGSILKREDIILERFIPDLILTNLVEEVKEEL